MRDELQELYDSLTDCLDRGDAEAATQVVASLPAPDIADLFRGIDGPYKIEILRRLPAEQSAAVLAEVDDRSLPELFEILQDEEIVGLLDTLPSDDAADLVGQLEDDREGRVLELLERVDEQDAIEVEELLRYPDDSAGGVMAKEVLALREDMTLAAAVEELRSRDEDERTTLHYGFVVDADGRLVGHLGIVELVLGQPSATVASIADRDTISVGVLEDQEEVANLMQKHDLMSLPVVDPEGRLVGRVTVDDAMDVLVEEATEDAARMAGVESEDVGETSILRISRARLPWLVLGLIGQLLAALVLSRFEESLRTRVILTFFIPLIMATGGNTGIQSSAIMIRLLVTQEFDRFRAGRHLFREVVVSLLMGTLLGAIMMGVLYLWEGDLAVGVVIGTALLSIVLIAATVGSMVPFLLHRVNIDPTVATGPFITTLNDVLGLAVYLLLARWLLGAL